MAETIKAYCIINKIELITCVDDTNICIKAKFCGHSKNITWEHLQKPNEISFCEYCYAKKKLTYNRCLEIFKDRGCKVLCDEDEFINNNICCENASEYMVEYKFPCGHNMVSTVGEFQDAHMCTKCVE